MTPQRPVQIVQANTPPTSGDVQIHSTNPVQPSKPDHRTSPNQQPPTNGKERATLKAQLDSHYDYKSFYKDSCFSTPILPSYYFPNGVDSGSVQLRN